MNGRWGAVLLAAGIASGCGARPEPPQPGPPNFLVVVWDTVRADRLGVYGYDRPTTPFLDAWSASARVYDDCVSAAPYTVASHASLFTGLPPTEHGASNRHAFLDDRHATLAERLRDAGYQTYLYSANPHISEAENFHRGFDRAEHPWDEDRRREALRIVAAKIAPHDASSELAAKIRAGRPKGGWDIKASGELANRGVEAWLARRDPERPFFAFLNYMEAHRPWIPPAKYREARMTPEQVERSYVVDRSWLPLWSYTFGLHEYSPEELEVMSGTYDACLAELDDLFRDLIERLDRAGALDNTVVVLTSDHGEHLGEHHRMDHQYSLYEPLLRVPLVVRGAPWFPPGRDPRPTMVHDLFPTLLDLAGAAVPESRGAADLRTAVPDRTRLAEYLGPFRDAFAAVESAHPEFRRAPWEREIRALYRGPHKLIRWSDGERALYRLDHDPTERTDVATADPDRMRDLEAALDAALGALRPATVPDATRPSMSDEHRERLRSLGYVHGGPDGTDAP